MTKGLFSHRKKKTWQTQPCANDLSIILHYRARWNATLQKEWNSRKNEDDAFCYSCSKNTHQLCNFFLARSSSCTKYAKWRVASNCFFFFVWHLGKLRTSRQCSFLGLTWTRPRRWRGDIFMVWKNSFNQRKTQLRFDTALTWIWLIVNSLENHKSRSLHDSGRHSLKSLFSHLPSAICQNRAPRTTNICFGVTLHPSLLPHFHVNTAFPNSILYISSTPPPADITPGDSKPTSERKLCCTPPKPLVQGKTNPVSYTSYVAHLMALVAWCLTYQ